MAKKSSTEWFINEIESETEQVKRAVAQLKFCSVKRYHIRHGVEIMALSVGIKKLWKVPEHTLYQWSVRRFAEILRKERPPHGQAELNKFIRGFSFYYGRDIVLKQLKGVTR